MFPAANAGATFQVESSHGAFQGVMITVGPAGIRWMVLAVPLEAHCRSVWAVARSA